MGRRRWVAGGGGLSIGLLAASASGAFTQAQCPSPSQAVPSDIGARDFGQDVNNSANYANSEHYSWNVMVNSNVSQSVFWYNNFITQSGVDYLELQGHGQSTQISGDLSAGGFRILSPLQSGEGSPKYRATWYSNLNTNFSSIPVLSAVSPLCYAEQQPTVNRGFLAINERHDGVLIATGDVVYVAFQQPANTRLLLTLDAVAASSNSADFDLYASTSTATPDDNNYTWRDNALNFTGSLRGAGAAISTNWFPPFWAPYARTVYVGVRSKYGAGHFSLRANVAKAGGEGKMTPTYTVCTPGVNMQTSPYRTAVTETLRRGVLRMTQVTHGNYQPTDFVYKQTTDNCTQFCSNDSSCDICMTTPCAGDSCTVGQSSGSKIRIAYHNCGNYNNPERASQIIAHELSHAIFSLPDEYAPWGVGQSWFCGHSLLNGPTAQSNYWCTSLNHCRDQGAGTTGPQHGTGACASGTSAWSRALDLSPYQDLWVTKPTNLTSSSAQPGLAFSGNLRSMGTIGVSYQ